MRGIAAVSVKGSSGNLPDSTTERWNFVSFEKEIINFCLLSIFGPLGPDDTPGPQLRGERDEKEAGKARQADHAAYGKVRDLPRAVNVSHAWIGSERGETCNATRPIPHTKTWP